MLAAGLDGIEAFVLDVDGVLRERDVPIDGAAETLARLGAAGIPYRLLTNTTSTSRRVLAEGLIGAGFPVTLEQVFCPPHAAGEHLRERGDSAFLLVQEGALEDFDGVTRQEEGADVVVVGDLDQGWTFDLLNRAFRILHRDGARLLGLGRSRYWMASAGLQLDAGPFVAALEYAAGVEARIFGKPEPAIFEAVIADLGLPAARIAMVGDDIRSDVQAAMTVGLRGVLVRTGKFRDADLEQGIEPDLVLVSVNDVLNG
jgi:HAD superfamily hydrolase (TIGR01458 family)